MVAFVVLVLAPAFVFCLFCLRGFWIEAHSDRLARTEVARQIPDPVRLPSASGPRTTATVIEFGTEKAVNAVNRGAA